MEGAYNAIPANAVIPAAVSLQMVTNPTAIATESDDQSSVVADHLQMAAGDQDELALPMATRSRGEGLGLDNVC